jgi:hypothetical protein
MSDTQSSGSGRSALGKLKANVYCTPGSPINPDKKDLIRKIEEDAAKKELTRLVPEKMEAETPKKSQRQARKKEKAKASGAERNLGAKAGTAKPIPEEFMLVGGESRNMTFLVSPLVNGLLDLVHRMEKQRERRRTKADIVNDSIAAYIRAKLKEFGYNTANLKI